MTNPIQQEEEKIIRSLKDTSYGVKHLLTPTHKTAILANVQLSVMIGQLLRICCLSLRG